MPNNSITTTVEGREVLTLRDILPTQFGLRALFVAKTPAPPSVKAGHYFQGSQGQAFWRRLHEYRLLEPKTEYEDDSLLAHGFGLTDVVKVPRSFRDEPSDVEYLAGTDRILGLIRNHRPLVTVFVYKRVLDQILKLRFGVCQKSEYGFNPMAAANFGCEVFAFPLPGVGSCTREQANRSMIELQSRLLETKAYDLSCHLMGNGRSIQGRRS